MLEPTRESIASGGALRELKQASPGGVPTVLVLDHLHHLDPAQWDCTAASVIASILPTQHVVLVVRQEIPPALRCASAPLGGHLIGSDDLRFTAAECRELLAFRSSPANDVNWSDGVHRMTGGWPVAIASLAHTPTLLLGTSAAVDPEPATFGESLPRSFVPGHRWETYVCEQILDAQPPRARAFLLASALLGEAHASLCDMVLGSADSRDTIQLLLEGELLQAVPAEDGWFTHHPLLAETLHRLQHRDDPLWSRAVHQRAARWHLARGDRRRAVSQFLALGDYRQAASLLVDDRPLAPPAASSVPTDGTVRGTSLTTRETEVLDLIRSGLGNKQIGQKLCVSLATVKAHVYNIFRKLGVTSRTAALAHGTKEAASFDRR